MTDTPNDPRQAGESVHPGDALGEWAQTMRSKGDGAKIIDLLQAIDDWMMVCHQQESCLESAEELLVRVDPDDLRPVVFDAVVDAWMDGHVAVTTAVVTALGGHFGRRGQS